MGIPVSSSEGWGLVPIVSKTYFRRGETKRTGVPVVDRDLPPVSSPSGPRLHLLRRLRLEKGDSGVCSFVSFSLGSGLTRFF